MFEKTFAKYTPQKSGGRATQRYFDKVFAGYEPPKQEPEEENDGGVLDTIKNFAKDWALPLFPAMNFVTSSAPELLGGSVAEIVGNIAKGLGKEFGEDSWRKRGLDYIGDFAHEVANSALERGTNQVETGDNDTYRGSFGNSFESGAYGVLGGLASMVHADKSANAFNQAVQKLADQTPIEPELSLEYLTSPHGLTRSAGQTVGSMAAILPTMFAAPETLGLRAASALGGDALTNFLIGRGLFGTAKQFAQGAPRAMQYGLTSPWVEGAAEGGHVRQENLEQGVSDEEATRRSINTMAANVPTLMLSNTAEGLLLGAPILRNGSSAFQKALQGVARWQLNAAQQGLEEGTQAAISNSQLGKPYSFNPLNYTDEQAREAWEGYFGSLPLGIAPAVSHVTRKPNEDVKNYERGWRREFSNDFYFDRANRVAVNSGVENFMRAIVQQESGGNYDLTNSDSGAAGAFQIMPDNWSAWAKDAGLSPDAPMTPENQNIVARNKMLEYFNKFGNWRDVAIAWYGGESAVNWSEEKKNRPQGKYPSVNEYADSVMARFATSGGEIQGEQSGDNQQGIDFQTGLAAAKRNLDGRQMDNGTVGCVEAVTKILAHVHPEFQKMVEDGVVNTVEGENNLHKRLEQMGVEIIPFDESKVAQGDIIFYDGEQTYQHVLVADHMDEQGNWRVFGNSSSNNKVMEQPLYQGQKPSWIAKVSNLRSDAPTSRNTSTAPQEQAKPLFDINAEDDRTKKLFEQFARERYESSTGEQAAEDNLFFEPMFKDGKFEDTAENRQAIWERYGDEFSAWANSQKQTQPEKPQAKSGQSSPYLNNEPFMEALNQLRERAIENRNLGLLNQIENAQNNPSEIENLLRQNGITIAQPQNQSQPTQDPVQNNQSPENVLTQPAQVNANEYVQTALLHPVGGNNKAAKTARLEQAKKLTVLANQHGIKIPPDVKPSLERGAIKAISATQELLLNSGKLFNSEPQRVETPQQLNFSDDLNFAYQDISADRTDRKKQGAAILRVVNFSQAVNSPQLQQQYGLHFPKVDLPEGLEIALRNGDERGISRAQEILNHAGLKIETAPTEESEPTADGIRGNTAEVITGSRKAHQVQYRVVEADELNSSHAIENGNVFANENYPSELQPRDRQRSDMQAQLISMGNNLNPSDLLDARDVNQGAPTTRNDGVVLNGNGRVAAIRYAYKQGKGNSYKDTLIQNAERFGLNANEISAMNQPVLVRELTHNLTADELRDLTGTQTGGARMSASEQAKADAERLSRETLSTFPQNDNVDLSNAESTDFLRAALADIAAPNELNSLTTADGRINQDGINRVKRALFALAYGDEELISRMSESTDDNVRSATNALLTAAPTIAKVQAAMRNGTAHNYDLSPIADAVKKISALRDEGKSVSNYLQEQNLFAEHADSEEMKEILSVLDQNKNAPKKNAAFLKEIARGIQNQGDPREANLFGGETKAAPLIDLIRRARQEIENSGMSNLFTQEENQNGTNQTTATEENTHSEENTNQNSQPRQTSSQEVTPKKSKGKWVTVLSSGSREELQKFMRKELYNDTLTIQDDGKVFDEVHGRNIKYTVRNNRGRWQLGYNEGDLEYAPKPKTEPQDESEEFFMKHQNIYMDDTPYFGAAIKSGAFPDIGGTNSFGKSIEKSLDEIVESYGGRHASLIRDSIKNFGFETAEKRDRFVRSVMQSGLLDTEHDRRVRLVREREEQIKTDAARQAEKDKIISEIKSEAYEILEAEKYPEIKNWLDRQIQGAIRKKNVETVAEYEELAKSVIKVVKKYKAEQNPARDAAFEVLYQWHKGRPTDSRGRISHANSDKYSKAEDIIRQADHGELSFDEAYAEMKYFLRVGRRKNAGAIVDKAAKDPDTRRALEQLGAKIKNGKVTYPDEQTRQLCINHVSNIQARGTKQSKVGNIDTAISNFVAPENLTEQQKLIQRLGEDLGVRVVFFDNENGEFHGAHAGNISYINVNSKMPLGKVFWHEAGHWLKANNPKLWQRLVEAAGITDAQRKAYVKEHGREDLTSDEEIDEEIVADHMEDAMRREGFLKDVGRKDKSLIQRVISWLQDVLGKFKKFLRNPQGKLTTEQFNRMADELGRIARNLVDQNGNKIFRYNSRTHEIELVDGEKLPETKKAAVTVTGDEFGEYSDLKDLRNKAKDFYKNNLRGTSVRNPILGEVELADDTVMFTNTGLNKMGATSAQYEKILLVRHLPKLIENADRVSSKENYKDKRNVSQYSYLHSTALIDGKIRDVNITIFSDANGNRYYNHNLNGAMKTLEGLSVHLAQAPKVRNGIPIIDKPSVENISQPESDSKLKYSIDASDNSDESLMQRIRNKLPAWIGSTTDLNERRNKGIVRKLKQLSGYKIAFGHTGADETIVDDLQKVIRTRHGYDWQKIMPAVGKKIARNFKLNATNEMGNYIADWILTGAPNNTSAEAKAFQKAARENPAMFELINSVRNDFQEYANMSPNERIKSKIVSELPKKSLFERIGEMRRNFKEEFIDDLNPLKQMLERIKTDFGAEVAAELERGIDPYKAARLYRGSGGMVDIMIHGKAKDVEKIRSALSERYPNVNFGKFKPLETIIAEAGGIKKLKDFEAFCLAKQTKEIYEWNRKHPDRKIKPAFSEADCDAVIKAGEKIFGATQKDLVHFSKTMLSMMYDAGLLTKESYYSMINKWKNYVPMARVFDENEEIDFSNSLKRREGSERDIYSPVQKLIANTQEFIKRAERNKVKLTLANLARCGGYGEFVEEVEGKNPNVKDIITFKENGVKKYLQTDPSIVRAVNNLQTQSDGTWIFKILNAATSFMRSALTVFNPDYSAGNIFRDTADAFIHNKYYGTKARPWLAFTDAWRGLMSMIHRDAEYYEWLANGGAQSTLVSPDINYSRRMIDDITKTARQRWLSKDFFSQVLDGMQKVAEYSEYATRLGTYKRAKSALGSTVTDKRKAALMSRDATIDFARAGNSMRAVNRFAAFSNAAVQGIDRTIRTFDPRKLKTKDGRKEWFGAVARMSMTAVIPAVLQFALNYSDDDRWKKYKQRHDWEKETYWIFGDGFRIPKGMDFSIRLASALTDEFLRSWADSSPFEVKRFVQTVKDAAPSLTATMFTPLVEVGFNRSWFRDAPIVPVREQKLPAHLQFGNDTSPMAKIIGEQTGFSPRKIDHLISGYLGFMGRFASNPSLETDKLPMVRRFVFDPYKNPRIIKEYYEAYDEQTALFNDYKLTKKKPDGYDAALYGRLKTAHEPMSKLSKQERRILEDPKLTSDERKAKLQELEKRRVAICERIFKQAQ